MKCDVVVKLKNFPYLKPCLDEPKFMLEVGARRVVPQVVEEFLCEHHSKVFKETFPELKEYVKELE